MSDKPSIHPSPLRILRAWLFRERAVRGPAAIELDVIERQIDREQQAVTGAAGEAQTIARRLQRVREKVRAAMTDKATPGVIDADETRGIARDLIGVTVQAHHHKQSLEALT